MAFNMTLANKIILGLVDSNAVRNEFCILENSNQSKIEKNEMTKPIIKSSLSSDADRVDIAALMKHVKSKRSNKDHDDQSEWLHLLQAMFSVVDFVSGVIGKASHVVHTVLSKVNTVIGRVLGTRFVVHYDVHDKSD